MFHWGSWDTYRIKAIGNKMIKRKKRDWGSKNFIKALKP